MPVEIRELSIKVNVNSSNENSSGEDGHSIDTESIIQECVDQVLEIINREKER